jgi:hypothetical protein
MSLPGFNAQQSLHTAWGATQAGGKPITSIGEARRVTTVKGSIVPQYLRCRAGYCLVSCSGGLRCVPDRCSNGYCYCVPPPGCVIA